jgi:hypothetical protein
MAHESDAASLLDELRKDTELDGELERCALARVEQRLLLRVIEGGQGGDQPEPPRSRTERARRTRWWRGARGGMAAALLVGTALGAGGHAAVSFVVNHAISPNVAPQPAKEKSAKTSRATGQGERHLRADDATIAQALEAPLTPSRDTIDLPLNPQPAQPKPAAAPESAASLELELSELEMARRAVARGDGATGLRELRQHTQRYPGSVLAQERDALTVKALVLSGRYDEARTLGAGFRARHPNSMLLDSVERALASIP